jgi:hypothetical protein
VLLAGESGRRLSETCGSDARDQAQESREVREQFGDTTVVKLFGNAALK